MKHRLYLSIQSFVTELLFNVTLHGKYVLIDPNIDLVFHRRFMTIDEYLAWATRQVVVHLESFLRLLQSNPNIHELYHIMDTIRQDVDVLFDIEQLLRSILPFSVYMDNKEAIYESYFELIECYLEDHLLFQSMDPTSLSAVAAPSEAPISTEPVEESIVLTPKMDEEDEEVPDATVRISEELTERLAANPPEPEITEQEPEITEQEPEFLDDESETESVKVEKEPELGDTVTEIAEEDDVSISDEEEVTDTVEEVPFASVTVDVEALRLLEEKHKIFPFPMEHAAFFEKEVRRPLTSVIDQQCHLDKNFNDNLSLKACRILYSGRLDPWKPVERQSGESSEQFQERWTSDLYTYVCKMRDLFVPISVRTLRVFNIMDPLHVYYVALRICKNAMTREDKWKFTTIGRDLIVLLVPLMKIANLRELPTEKAFFTAKWCIQTLIQVLST